MKILKLTAFATLRGVWTNFFWSKSSAVTFYYCNVNKSIHFWNGNESENPFLISNSTKNADFLRKWQKITFLVKNFCDKLKKNNFELKMLKLLENHVKTQLQFLFFFQIFEVSNMFQNFDQKKVEKHDFLPKNHFFGTFWPNFSKRYSLN